MPPSEAILSVQDVSVSYGAQPVLDGVSLTVHAGDRIGLIGRNGSGKSTLLRVVAGLETPQEGFTTRKQGLRVVLLAQESGRTAGRTVRDVLDDAVAEVRSLTTQYHDSVDALARTHIDDPAHARLAEDVTAAEHRLATADAWDLDETLKRVTVALQLPEPGRQLDSLSGGELRRLDLAAAVVQRPEVLLLDEPTNHIDVASVQWIEDYLAAYAGACVLITHDRYFLDRIASRIVELETCRLTGFPGNYTEFLARKTAKQEIDASAEVSRRAIMRRELAWLRQGAKARSTKQKARIARYDELEASAPQRAAREAVFEIPRPQRLGKRILEVESVSRSYGDHVLFRDLSLIMLKDMRLGVVGPNGCGKTTLLRVLMALEQPDTGKVVCGDATEFLYLDQTHEEVNPSTTVLDHVSRNAATIEVNGRRVFVPSYLERFLFDQHSIRMPMQNLSGGERNRIDIAKKLLRGGNFLILDEPTNDLDLSTLRLLEEAVLSFDGCAVIVSHDRYFLNRLCTHVLIFEDNGNVLQIAGNYDDYRHYKAGEPQQVSDKARPEKRPTRRRTAATKPRGLAWREKKELEGLEDRIEAAEAKLRQLEANVGDPTFYDQEHQSVRATLEAFEEARSQLEELYDRWAVLSDIDETSHLDTTR